MKNFDATHTEREDSGLIAWIIVYAVLGIKAIVFNALALSIFIKTRSLRTRKHVMVMNLAVADLLFGAFVPFLLVYIFKPTIFPNYMGQILIPFFKNSLSYYSCCHCLGTNARGHLANTTPRYG